MLPSNAPRCPMFMRPHGMAVTGIDCIHMPGIGRTFTVYWSMITSNTNSTCCVLELPILMLHTILVWSHYDVFTTDCHVFTPAWYEHTTTVNAPTNINIHISQLNPHNSHQNNHFRPARSAHSYMNTNEQLCDRRRTWRGAQTCAPR
jgi:hypothetical protein